MNKALKLILGTAVYLLEQSDKATKGARGRAADHFDDLRDAAQEKYETAADRLNRASAVIKGEDSNVMGNVLSLAAGIGIGVGLGILLAPASGEETRSNLVDRVHNIGDRLRDEYEAETATGTGR
jgi:gas vesicle protein